MNSIGDRSIVQILKQKSNETISNENTHSKFKMQLNLKEREKKICSR